MKFKSLNTRITFIFLILILSIQILGSVIIRMSIEKNARASVNEQLTIGEKLFLSLLNQNGESLSLGARILAIDYGFRTAIGSHDNETILSALSNQQQRLGADISVFYTSDNNNLIISGDLSHDDIQSTVYKLVENVQANSDARNFAIFKNQPYQLVAVPIKAPLTIGWVIMGFKIDNTLAEKLHKLSNLEVSFITEAKDRNFGLFKASTRE